MPSGCVLRYCRSRYGIDPERDYSLFSFPQDVNTKKKWIQFVRLERREKNWLPSVASKLCSKHFRKEDIYFGSTGRAVLKRVSLPYEFIPSAVNKKEQTQTELLNQTSTQNYQEEDDFKQNANSSNLSTSAHILKMCRVCLATNCKFYALTRFKNLDRAYKLLTGISSKNEIDLSPFLCNVCAHRLLNSIHFRSQSLRAHWVLLNAVNKHVEMKKPVTLESIKSFIGEQRLGTNLGIKHNPTDYYDLDITHVARENQNQVEILIKLEKEGDVDSDENVPDSPSYSLGMNNVPHCYVKIEEKRPEDEENIYNKIHNIEHIKIETETEKDNFRKAFVIDEIKNQGITDEKAKDNKPVSAGVLRKTVFKYYNRRKRSTIDQVRPINESTNDGKLSISVPASYEQVDVNHQSLNYNMMCGTSSSVKR